MQEKIAERMMRLFHFLTTKEARILRVECIILSISLVNYELLKSFLIFPFSVRMSNSFLDVRLMCMEGRKGGGSWLHMIQEDLPSFEIL